MAIQWAKVTGSSAANPIATPLTPPGHVSVPNAGLWQLNAPGEVGALYASNPGYTDIKDGRFTTWLKVREATDITYVKCAAIYGRLQQPFEAVFTDNVAYVVAVQPSTLNDFDFTPLKPLTFRLARSFDPASPIVVSADCPANTIVSGSGYVHVRLTIGGSSVRFEIETAVGWVILWDIVDTGIVDGGAWGYLNEASPADISLMAFDDAELCRQVLQDTSEECYLDDLNDGPDSDPIAPARWSVPGPAPGTGQGLYGNASPVFTAFGSGAGEFAAYFQQSGTEPYAFEEFQPFTTPPVDLYNCSLSGYLYCHWLGGASFCNVDPGMFLRAETYQSPIQNTAAYWVTLVEDGADIRVYLRRKLDLLEPPIASALLPAGALIVNGWAHLKIEASYNVITVYYNTGDQIVEQWTQLFSQNEAPGTELLAGKAGFAGVYPNLGAPMAAGFAWDHARLCRAAGSPGTPSGGPDGPPAGIPTDGVAYVDGITDTFAFEDAGTWVTIERPVDLTYREGPNGQLWELMANSQSYKVSGVEMRYSEVSVLIDSTGNNPAGARFTAAGTPLDVDIAATILLRRKVAGTYPAGVQGAAAQHVGGGIFCRGQGAGGSEAGDDAYWLTLDDTQVLAMDPPTAISLLQWHLYKGLDTGATLLASGWFVNPNLSGGITDDAAFINLRMVVRNVGPNAEIHIYEGANYSGEAKPADEEQYQLNWKRLAKVIDAAPLAAGDCGVFCNNPGAVSYARMVLGRVSVFEYKDEWRLIHSPDFLSINDRKGDYPTVAPGPFTIGSDTPFDDYAGGTIFGQNQTAFGSMILDNGPVIPNRGHVVGLDCASDGQGKGVTFGTLAEFENRAGHTGRGKQIQAWLAQTGAAGNKIGVGFRTLVDAVDVLTLGAFGSLVVPGFFAYLDFSTGSPQVGLSNCWGFNPYAGLVANSVLATAPLSAVPVNSVWRHIRLEIDYVADEVQVWEETGPGSWTKVIGYPLPRTFASFEFDIVDGGDCQMPCVVGYTDHDPTVLGSLCGYYCDVEYSERNNRASIVQLLRAKNTEAAMPTEGGDGMIRYVGGDTLETDPGSGQWWSHTPHSGSSSLVTPGAKVEINSAGGNAGAQWIQSGNDTFGVRQGDFQSFITRIGVNSGNGENAAGFYLKADDGPISAGSQAIWLRFNPADIGGVGPYNFDIFDTFNSGGVPLVSAAFPGVFVDAAGFLTLKVQCYRTVREHFYVAVFADVSDSLGQAPIWQIAGVAAIRVGSVPPGSKCGVYGESGGGATKVVFNRFLVQRNYLYHLSEYVDDFETYAANVEEAEPNTNIKRWRSGPAPAVHSVVTVGPEKVVRIADAGDHAYLMFAKTSRLDNDFRDPANNFSVEFLALPDANTRLVVGVGDIDTQLKTAASIAGLQFHGCYVRNPGAPTVGVIDTVNGAAVGSEVGLPVHVQVNGFSHLRFGFRAVEDRHIVKLQYNIGTFENPDWQDAIEWANIDPVAPTSPGSSQLVFLADRTAGVGVQADVDFVKIIGPHYWPWFTDSPFISPHIES